MHPILTADRIRDFIEIATALKKKVADTQGGLVAKQPIRDFVDEATFDIISPDHKANNEQWWGNFEDALENVLEYVQAIRVG